MLDGATVEHMAAAIRSPDRDAFASVVAVQPDGSRTPLFLVMRAGALVSARQMVPELGPDQPLYGLWVPAMHGPAEAAGGIEDIARECVRVVRDVQPSGPYQLLGHSMGGLVAYDMARQLDDAGEQVGVVLLADAVHPSVVDRQPPPGSASRGARTGRRFTRTGARRALGRVRRRLSGHAVEYVPGTDQPIDRQAAFARELAYEPVAAVAPVVLFTTHHFVEAYGSEVLGWDPLLNDDWTVVGVPGSHDSMIGEPHVHVLGAHIAAQLRRVAG